jgi:integrase/recombinase XerD
MFEEFIKERIYLKNVSKRTVDFYRDCFRSFERYGGEVSEQGLKKYVIKMREGGVKPISCNTYISGINAYLRWLGSPLKITKLKVAHQVPESLPESNLKAILSFKANNFGGLRLHAILCLLIDTGCRIDEVLSIKRNAVDFDNLVLKVRGKGNKERLVPMSLEARKILFQFIKRHNFDLVFPTRHGNKVTYHNLNRDYRRLCEKLKIEKIGSFHKLRHTFALHYVRSGGGLFHLQKQLGHSTLTMTRRYTELETKDLQTAHRSLLSHM